MNNNYIICMDGHFHNPRSPCRICRNDGGYKCSACNQYMDYAADNNDWWFHSN